MSEATGDIRNPIQKVLTSGSVNRDSLTRFSSITNVKATTGRGRALVLRAMCKVEAVFNILLDRISRLRKSSLSGRSIQNIHSVAGRHWI